MEKSTASSLNPYGLLEIHHYFKKQATSMEMACLSIPLYILDDGRSLSLIHISMCIRDSPWTAWAAASVSEFAPLPPSPWFPRRASSSSRMCSTTWSPLWLRRRTFRTTPSRAVSYTHLISRISKPRSRTFSIYFF